MIMFENRLRTIVEWTKNGYYVHVIHALLQMVTGNTFLSATLAIKLYSLNYFYWYGHLYTYGRKATIRSRSSQASQRGLGSMYTYLPSHNWVKQFIRMTDTGLALLIGPLFVYDFVPRFLPLAFNVHFIIMAAYWLSKGVLGMKDADPFLRPMGGERYATRTVAQFETDRLVAPGLDEWHMDLLTYVHHTAPYCLLYLFPHSSELGCSYDYSHATLLYTYGWVYAWFLGIYCPWRLLTGDTVYSILDTEKTSAFLLVGFLGFMHILVWFSNNVGYTVCLVRSL